MFKTEPIKNFQNSLEPCIKLSRVETPLGSPELYGARRDASSRPINDQWTMDRPTIAYSLDKQGLTISVEQFVRGTVN